MRTNIEIDDKLMKQAMKATGATTKKAAVDAALRKVVKLKKQEGVRKLFGKIQWEGKKPLSELCNRITGTYIAPNYPYNIAGNLYDSNGYFNGQTQNNFPFSFQPTNYPMYAADPAHGYDEACLPTR